MWHCLPLALPRHSFIFSFDCFLIPLWDQRLKEEMCMLNKLYCSINFYLKTAINLSIKDIVISPHSNSFEHIENTHIHKTTNIINQKMS